MNDNEKAATYIGWKPRQRCLIEYSEPSRAAFSSAGSTCHCACGSPPPWTEIHDIPAPDMSNPRNYMKAVEALAARQDESDAASPDLGYRHPFGWFLDVAPISTDWHPTPGEAAVSALAALYDAEHLEGGSK